MIHYVCSAYFRCLIQNFWWNVPPNAILKPGPESRQVLHPHVISQNMLGFGFWCILFIYLFHLFGKKTWSRRWKPRRDIPSISGATALASDIQHGSKVCDEGCSMVVIGCNWDLETYDPPKSSQVISSPKWPVNWSHKAHSEFGRQDADATFWAQARARIPRPPQWLGHFGTRPATPMQRCSWMAGFFSRLQAPKGLPSFNMF